MGEKKKPLVFVKDPEHAWVPATLVKQEGDKATVSVPKYKDEQSMICDGGRSSKDAEERVVKLKDYPNKVLPLQNVDGNNNMPEYADMVQLPYLHEVRITVVPGAVIHPSHSLTRILAHPSDLFLTLCRRLSCTT